MKISKRVLHRWWPLAIVLVPQMLPPYTSTGYKITDWGMVNAYLLTHPIRNPFTNYQLFFQMVPLILLILVFLIGSRISRFFNVYIAICYFIISFVQSVSITELYGVSVCISNLISFSMLGVLWLGESIIVKNKLEIRKTFGLSHIILIIALIVFWGPVNPKSLLPDFNPKYIFTNSTGLTFCMLTPLVLSILLFAYPKINRVVFGATSILGVVIGIGNMVLEFIIYPAYWWIGVLHIPLLLISSFCLWLFLKPAQPGAAADLSFGFVSS
jgi:hypothetical protein